MDTTQSSEMIYLISPYSDPNPDVVASRMQELSYVDMRMIQQGLFTVSPLAKHYTIIAYPNAKIPTDWEFWKRYCRELMLGCDRAAIVLINGWQHSVGVQAEYKMAVELGIPVVIVNNFGYNIVVEEHTEQWLKSEVPHWFETIPTTWNVGWREYDQARANLDWYDAMPNTTKMKLPPDTDALLLNAALEWLDVDNLRKAYPNIISVKVINNCRLQFDVWFEVENGSRHHRIVDIARRVDQEYALE
jgi:hypothetical protein